MLFSSNRPIKSGWCSISHTYCCIPFPYWNSARLLAISWLYRGGVVSAVGDWLWVNDTRGIHHLHSSASWMERSAHRIIHAIPSVTSKRDMNEYDVSPYSLVQLTICFFLCSDPSHKGHHAACVCHQWCCDHVSAVRIQTRRVHCGFLQGILSSWPCNRLKCSLYAIAALNQSMHTIPYSCAIFFFYICYYNWFTDIKPSVSDVFAIIRWQTTIVSHSIVYTISLVVIKCIVSPIMKDCYGRRRRKT